MARPAVPALLRLINDPDESIREAVTNALTTIAPESFAHSDPGE